MQQLSLTYPRPTTDHVDAALAVLQRFGWTVDPRSLNRTRWCLPETDWCCRLNWYRTSFYRLIGCFPQGLLCLPTGNITAIQAQCARLALERGTL